MIVESKGVNRFFNHRNKISDRGILNKIIRNGG